ncbi:hypothetical protein A2971_03765 [Candidatus Gottesmanbacteria bacterium RIFCSPLOWO2_01_FULL_46_21]|uniref:Glycogen synthase n=1 Tax=Candidatus Gottesmanbacteria bacterium RIFCSPLOWO2_01_FULL_46_21 TaxID=1798393 RepID=A0A1F6AWG9_9BACT|nr:MAG: hypothetical protein A2971_03765 [Candidatus Gottesmanbacteria bacterium RIFCSPLOWO2_01_FULL_46_21]
MRVLFVTSEVATLFKLGGLADVSYALPSALKRLGVDIAIALPYYASMKIKKSHCIGPIAVSFEKRRELVFIFKCVLPGARVPVYLFRHPILNEYRAHADKLLQTRFAFFSQAVATYLTVAAMRGERWPIIHANDWHTALLPMLLGESPKVFFRTNGDITGLETLQASEVHTILTIHNPVYHGIVKAKLAKQIFLDTRQFHILKDGGTPYINMLREGIEYADVMTTVSPTFAREMLHGNYGPHVTGMLERRKDKILGILNGIDTTLWDPRIDPNLPRRYSIASVARVKPYIKRHLQRALRLLEKDSPLFGFIGRIEQNQKGIDILLGAVEPLLAAGSIQLAILGTGNPKLVKAIRALTKKYTTSVAFTHTFDERLARRMYAGCDVMVVPSRFEPCGLIQIIAMRYGTIPLVRKTGGLADTVTDGKTGFVFGPYTKTALRGAIERAIKRKYNDSAGWSKMVVRVMRQDHSWTKSARAYKRLYEKLSLTVDVLS